MFDIHVIYVKLDTEIKGWLFDFSVKVFELEVNSVNQSLMTNKQQKRQSADETVEEACSMNTSPTMPQNAKRKPGRPKSTNREDDEALYKQLRSNPEGKGIERTAWQNTKWDEFKAG